MTVDLETRLRDCLRGEAEQFTAGPDFDVVVTARAADLRHVAARRRHVVLAAAAGVALLATIGGLAWSRLGNSTGVDTPVPVTEPPSPDRTETGLAPGTWRELPASSLTPTRVMAAAWTGDEILMVGVDTRHPARECKPFGGACSVYDPYAVAFAPATGEWRRLADLPAAALEGWASPTYPAPIWTGSQMILFSLDEAPHVVLAYTPATDTWDVRQLPAAGVRYHGVATTDGGAMAWFDDEGWWWYDSATDGWTNVPEPPVRDGSKAELLAGVGPIVVAGIPLEAEPSDEISFTVFDPATLTWSAEVDVPVDPELARQVEFDSGFDPEFIDQMARGGYPIYRAGDRVVVYGGSEVCSTDGEGFTCSYAAKGAATTVSATDDVHEADGFVVDPRTGATTTFDGALDAWNSERTLVGVPWLAVGDDLLVHPATGDHESLRADAGTFALWTGTELVFIGSIPDDAQPTVLAYTPLTATP